MTETSAPAVATVAQVLELVGRGTIRHLTTCGLDRPARSLLVHDGCDPVTACEDAFVLAIGVRPETAEALSLVKALAAAGAAAVAFKPHGASLGRLAGTAESASVALLAIDERVTWERVLSMLSAALDRSEQFGTEDGLLPDEGGLFSLANAIAAVVGGAVAIEDNDRHVLAYSSLVDQPIDEARRQGILGRQVPDHPKASGMYRAVWRSASAIRADFEQGYPRLAVAVRAGTETVGSIWVIESEPLDDVACRALERAAPLVALHLLRQRTQSAAERLSASTLLAELLSGGGDAETVASTLGLAPGSDIALLGFRLSGGAEGVRPSAHLVADLAHVAAANRRARAISATVGSTVYVALPESERSQTGWAAAVAAQVARDVVRRCHQSAKIMVDCAVAEPCPLMGLADARRDLEHLHRIHRSEPPCAAVRTVRDSRAAIALVRISDLVQGDPSLRPPVLDGLRQHDAARSSGYEETLRAYLDTFGDVAAASARLSVHPNSFRHRLRRISELFSLDLADPDLRLWLSLFLRLKANS